MSIVPTMSINAVIDTLRALYSFKNEANAKQLHQVAGISSQNTSSCLRIAFSLGLVEGTEKRGSYNLTRNGREFTRLLEYDKEKDAKDMLQKIILERSEWSDIVSFLRTCKDKSHDYLDLVGYIESKTDKQLKKEVRRMVLRSIRSILVFSDLIEDNSKQLVSRIGIDKTSEERNLDSIKDLVAAGESDEDETGSLQEKIDNYAILTIPNKFKIMVLNNREAIEEIKKQIIEGSSISMWLDTILQNLEGEE